MIKTLQEMARRLLSLGMGGSPADSDDHTEFEQVDAHRLQPEDFRSSGCMQLHPSVPIDFGDTIPACGLAISSRPDAEERRIQLAFL
jgi:hypothetical protein